MRIDFVKILVMIITFGAVVRMFLEGCMPFGRREDGSVIEDEYAKDFLRGKR